MGSELKISRTRHNLPPESCTERVRTDNLLNFCFFCFFFFAFIKFQPILSLSVWCSWCHRLQQRLRAAKCLLIKEPNHNEFVQTLAPSIP
jgi:hypothetical protein